MHPNEELIHTFYSAFQRKDGAAMAACYDKEAAFSDPVFVGLRGEQVGSMWQMLCERGQDLVVTFSDVRANDAAGAAHWEATYSFSRSGRKVHNVIEAAFVFKDGRILKHTDTFDLWRWAGMALGLQGQLLGWAPPMQAAIRKNAMSGLETYMKRRNL